MKRRLNTTAGRIRKRLARAPRSRHIAPKIPRHLPAVAHASPWSFLPHFVVNGCVLALGGVGFALAQRPIRPPPE